MILDADLTMPPGDLPKFFAAVATGIVISQTVAAWCIPWNVGQCGFSTCARKRLSAFLLQGFYPRMGMFCFDTLNLGPCIVL